MRLLNIAIAMLALCGALFIAPAQADPAPATLKLESKREWRAVKPELYVNPIPRYGAPRRLPIARHQIVPGTNSPFERFALHKRLKKARAMRPASPNYRAQWLDDEHFTNSEATSLKVAGNPKF
ncbi:hypothetical protein EON83_20410 [bacterium]|nr:MAG: hypothetical protein EON83_20410 [bacterium]